jgi:hypothetical protein
MTTTGNGFGPVQTEERGTSVTPFYPPITVTLPVWPADSTATGIVPQLRDNSKGSKGSGYAGKAGEV